MPPATTGHPATYGTSTSHFFRRFIDLIFTVISGSAAFALLVLLGAIALLLLQGSTFTWGFYGLSFIWGTKWQQASAYAGVYGAAPFIVGTLASSVIALAIAVPVSLGIAIFLSEHCPASLRMPLTSLVELLAAVPSVVFGFWGLEVLVPMMGKTVLPGLASVFGTGYFLPPYPGTGLLTAGLILAVMIIPTIAALSREAMMAVPQHQREAALSLGATKWESVRTGVLKYARSGIAGGIILGLGRAVGETMAVVLVISNIDTFPACVSCSAATLASVIANEFPDPAGPAHLSALIALALVLLLITLVINVGARMLIWRLAGRTGSGGWRGAFRRRRGTGRTLQETSTGPAGAAGGPEDGRGPMATAGRRGLGRRGSARSPSLSLHTRDVRRRWFNRIMAALALACVVIALVPLADIILTAVVNGGAVMNWHFLVGQEYWAPCTLGVNGCPTGGIGPAIQSTLVLMGLSALWAIPVGVLAAIFLVEFCAGARPLVAAIGRGISFFMDVMSGIPTIVMALFIWTMFYLYNPGGWGIQSAVSQSLALGVIMVPIVVRTAEEALRLVPHTLREAAWGLGAPRYRTTMRVVLRTGAAPLLTGALLASARVGGETAPFLFLGFSRLSIFQNCTGGGISTTCLQHPAGPLGILIYEFALSPGTNNIAAAWGASLVFIFLMLGLSLMARLLLRGKSMVAMGVG